MLAIRSFQTDYYMTHGIPDRAGVRQRLDRVVSQRVLAVLSEQIAALPHMGQAVYCIRHLHIALWLNLDQVDELQIARHWSTAIARAVQHEIQRGQTNNVVRFETIVQYLATFIEELLQGNPRWMFRRFEHLRDLPTGRAVALVLSAHSALPLLLELQRRHLLEAVIQRMSAEDVALVWGQGFGFDVLPDLPTQWARWLPQLRAVPLQSGASTAHARNALRLYLAVALAQGDHDRELAAVAQHLAWVYGVLGALAPHRLLQNPIGTLKRLLPREMRAARLWLDAVTENATGRNYLAALTAIVTDSTARVPNHTSALRAAPETAFSTNFAGLALLLPSIRVLGWHEILSRAGLYQLLVTATGRAMAPLAQGDPAPRVLAGLTPYEALQARDAVIAWPERDTSHIDHAFADLPGAAQATAIVQQLGQRLRGFGDSSGDFLCRQLIDVPGRIRITDQGLEIDLHRAPLSVVLHMAGYSGEQGPIPWLDNRLLAIHLPEGNR